MKSFYYNLDDAEFVDSAGEKMPRCVPELFYQELAEWRLFLRDRENRVRDLSAVAAWSAAVDCDYRADTAPMCRTPAENIAVDTSTGAVTVKLDATTAEFLAAVNGATRRRAYFELCGFNSDGGRELCLDFEIAARMILDPDPAASPETPETLATKSYVAAVIGSAAGSAYSAACAGISGAIASGGYVTSSGARAIADEAANSARSGAIVSGAEIVTTVGNYTVALTSGGGLVVSGSGGESMALSGGRVSLKADDQEIFVDSDGGIDIGAVNPGRGVSIHAGAGNINLNVDSEYGGVYVNSRPVLTELVTSTDSETTVVSGGVLSGGTSIIYTQPLTVFGFDSIESGARAMFKFTAASGATLAFASGAVQLVGQSSLDSGTRYVVAVGDGMAIVNSITIAGE